MNQYDKRQFFQEYKCKIIKKTFFFRFEINEHRCLNTPKFEPSHAKRALVMKNIKIDLFSDYDKIQFKFNDYENWDRYQAYLLRCRRLIY